MVTKSFINNLTTPLRGEVRPAAPSHDETDMQRMATIVGIADENILRRLRALGFTSETARLLWLMPSLQVAWADGYISLSEGEMLCRAACSRAAVSTLSAQVTFQQWLEQHPSESFFQEALISIHGILATLPPRDRVLLQADLLKHCTEVAVAARHTNGWSQPLAARENAVIQQIAAALSLAAEAQSKKTKRHDQ